MPTHRVTLEMNKSILGPTPIIEVRVGDADQWLEVTLLEDGLPYTPPEGANILFQVKRPDGGLTRSLPMTKVADPNVWKCEIPGQSFIYHGVSKEAFVAVYKGDDPGPTSQTVQLDVLPGTTDEKAVKYFDARINGLANDLEADVEENRKSFVAAQKERAEEFERTQKENEQTFNAAETKREEGETARKEAEQERVTAEQGRVSAEQSRVSSETARGNAESDRDTAERARASAEETRRSSETEREDQERARADAEQKRAAAEVERGTAEEARQTAEQGRVTAETERVDAETARSDAERERTSSETARKEAEQKRVDAEANREAAEADRQQEFDTNEAQRQEDFESAESERQKNEDARVEAESGRDTAEKARVEAETGRDTAEKARTEAETGRDTAEGERVEAEKGRATAEQGRVDADADRAERQTANDNRQAKNDADQAANNLAAQGRLTRILKAGEYDPDTRIPTIEGDLTHVFAVPTAEADAARAAVESAKQSLLQAQREQADASGDRPSFDGQVELATSALAKAQAVYEAANKYVEWLWLIDEDTGTGYWEQYGSGNTIILDPISTEEYDRMWAGESVETKHVAYSSGESYNVSKIRDALDTIKTDQSGVDSKQDEKITAAQSAADAAKQAAEKAATDASTALEEAVTAQGQKDTEQDGAITKAQEAADKAKERADEAYDHLPAVVSNDADGLAPKFGGSEGYLHNDGETATWKTIPLASVDGAGLAPQLPGDANKVWLGDGSFGEYKGGGMPDYRQLKKALTEADALKDSAKVGGGDYDFGTNVTDQDSLDAFTGAIAKAQAVLDAYEDPDTTQQTLDGAAGELQAAVETFRASCKPVQPDKSGLTEQESRYTTLKDGVSVSADGKDVAFGSKWVTTQEQTAADNALTTARNAVNAAKKQTEIDGAVSTLTSALDTYERAIKTATKDTAALDSAISAANEAKDGVLTSDSEGSDLPAGSKYVTTDQMSTFEDAIGAATSVKEGATKQSEIDKAASDLKSATSTFSSHVKQNVSIYGVTFASFPGTTKGVRTDAAAGFGDVKPAANNGSGSSPFDAIDPWKSMVPEDRKGGRMVPIKRFYYKLTQNGKGVNVQIATGPMDGFKVSPAHMDRNDGKGEREVVYVGRYHCATGTYKSTTGVNPAASATKANMISSIHSIDSTYHMMDFATRFTIWLLYIVETAEWNSQKLIGGGCSTSGSVMQMGYTDKMQYCTGTSAASIGATVYGGTQYRNIEGLWDNVYDFLSGCYNDSKGLNVITDTSKLGDSSGGKTIGLPVAGYPGELKVTETGGFPAFYPSAAGGSDSTGTCDSWGFDSGNPVVFVGGDYGQGSSRGMFYVSYASAARRLRTPAPTAAVASLNSLRGSARGVFPLATSSMDYDGQPRTRRKGLGTTGPSAAVR